MTIAGNFLSDLWANADSDALSVELRTIGRGSRWLRRTDLNSAPDVISQAEEKEFRCFSAAGFEGETTPSAMTNETATHFPALWVDIDLVPGVVKNDKTAIAAITPEIMFEAVKSVAAQLAQLPFKPSALVFSGGGLHCYWRLNEPATDAAAVEQLNKSLVRVVGGDEPVANPGRILRLPGSFNAKYGTNPQLVRVLAANWNDYEFDDLAEQADEYKLANVTKAVDLAKDTIAAAVGMTRQETAVAVGNGTFSLERIDGPSGERLDVEATKNRMLNHDQWNNGLTKLAGKAARMGMAKSVFLAEAAALTLPGYTVEETLAEAVDLYDRMVIKTETDGGPLVDPDQVDYQSWRDRFALVAPAGEFYEYATGSTYKLQNWQTAFKYLKNVSPVENNGRPVEYTKKWLDDHDATRVQHYDIEPGGPQIIQHGLAVNIWRPSVFDLLVDNGDPDGKGVPEFIQLVMSLCSDRQDIANQLMGWIGYGLTHQNKRMSWAPMLISEHGGTGKSSLMATVAALYGAHLQVEVPKVEQLIDGFIGDKIWNRTFVAVHETADTSFGNWGAFEALKTQITEKNPQLDIKYRQPVAVTNYRRFMFASNHLTGLPVGPHERRIMPIVLNGKGSLTDDFFDLYRGWIDNDDRNVLGNIAAYLAKYHGDTMPPRAPQADSATTQQAMVTDWADELDQYMRNKYPDGVQLLKKDVVAFACRYDDKKVSATQAGKVMERLGWDKDGREPERPGQVRRRTFILKDSEFMDRETLPLFVDTGKWPAY